MKLVTFRHDGRAQLGVVVDNVVHGINGLLDAADAVPDDMVAFLEQGDAAMDRARRAEEKARQGSRSTAAVPFDAADLMAPVPRPGKIMMGGRNYLRHLDELREEGKERGEKIITPPMPHIFAKYADSVTGHRQPVVYPEIVTKLDLEGEFSVVIGKRAYHVSEEDALDYIAGYTIINDVSARCLQAQGLLTISKGYETFCPMGPWMVTADEIPDPQDLGVRTYINDDLVSEAHTSEMLFSVRQFISSLSRVFPLAPGDVLSTGSPPGPGMYKNPPILTNVGDVMRIEVERVGVLENPVVAAS